MLEFSQFVAIADELFFLDPGLPDLNERTFVPIDLADLNTKRTAVLAFRLKVLGAVHLKMRFNSNEHCIDYTFDPPEPKTARPRSWHEVLPGSHLASENNYLLISTSGEGKVEISDLVLFYHAIIDVKSFG
jgi:hypothetical protein